MRKHRHELSVFLHDNDIDVIGLCETRLDEKVADSDVSTAGYKISRNDRDLNGGGVAIYVKESFPEPSVKLKSDSLELLVLELAPKNSKSFFLACWYRPPTSGVDIQAFEDLRNELKNLDQNEKEIILVGDTNCDFKCNRNSNANKLKFIYSEFQLEQLIKSYARVAVTHTDDGDPTVSKTLIDHFSTNKPNYILNVDIIETGMVDHYMIYGIRKVNASRLNSSKKQRLAETRSLKRYNKASFQQDLQEIDWDRLLAPLADEPSKMVTTFQEIFESLLNVHAPLKVKRLRNEFAPWLTSSVRDLMTKRDRMKKAATKNPLLWSNYKGLRNQCTYAIRKAIQDHYHGLIEETKDDPKKMWKTINRVLNKDSASKSISSLNVNGKVVTGEGELAEALNRHFVSVGPKLAEKIKTTPNDNPLKHIKPNDSATLILKPVTNSQVLKSLKQLKNGKACGPDKIPTTLVKDAANFISYPLTLIYNSSIKNGIFPDLWKIARVAAIFKSGKKCDSNNYRPISVLSIFSRVLEKIVHDQLHEFLKANGILTNNQYAFRKLYSTIMSLINSTEHWLENADNRKLNMTVFLDLKKAFDTVDHKILIDKLFKYGIKGKEREWFQSYLSGRKQFCSVNGQRSKTEEVLCGIPQGSCLGPLLFTVYLNDFEGCLDFSKANMYADDTHTTIASNDIKELVRMTKKELLNISDWLRVNKLSANPKKTEFMVIGHQRRINEIDDLPPLKLDDSEIKRVEKTKSLGVIIDEGLKWKDQYKSLTGKLAGGLSSLKKLKDVLPQSKLCDVYHALFESHIRYGNVVWGTISSSELQALQRLQNRALSIIERARFKDPWPKKWLSVMNLIRFDRCVMVYKIVNKQCPESLWNMFQQRRSISNYNTRNYRDLHIPKLNLELTKKGFHYSGIKAWNDIPVNIRELPSLRLFKTHLKRHLMSLDN